MNYPLKPNPSLHRETKSWKRSGWVLFAAVLAVVLTARLGFWQLGLAEEKIAWQVFSNKVCNMYLMDSNNKMILEHNSNKQ